MFCFGRTAPCNYLLKKFPHKAVWIDFNCCSSDNEQLFRMTFFPTEKQKSLDLRELHSCLRSLWIFFFFSCSCGAATSSFHSRKSRHHSLHLQHFGTQQLTSRPNPLLQSLQTDDATIITDKSKSLYIYRLKSCPHLANFNVLTVLIFSWIVWINDKRLYRDKNMCK